jgi:CRISPR-associated endonuclease/helicase Cas3
MEDNKTVPGIDVFGHCVIVGETAKALIQYFDFVPEVRDKLFPPGSELVAAVHDVGKICPVFQEKIYRASGYQPNSLPGLEDADPDMDRTWGGHAAVSQAALEESPKFIPEIAGRHHGYSTEKYPSNAEFFGGESWQKQREALVDKLKNRFGVDWPEVTSNIHAALLSGLTCVADWIASGSAFDGIDHIEHIHDLPLLVKAALETAGFVRPLINQGLSFKDIFNFNPYPMQVHLFEAASSPGIYVLEAPMGMGKTEAALYAAYKALVSGKACGIYFALPTRLTSNKIHERMDTFLKTILNEKSSHRQARLLYSSAWLYETELSEEGNPGASWFNAKKRGILAPFAAGTIDQALMAVMNVKHGFVRTFGLAGKVVILDEVHSYDSYTGTILDELVLGLRELGCTVIILSATLTNERREKFLGIAGTGHNTAGPDLSYPLISYVKEDSNSLGEIHTEASETRTVSLYHVSNDANALEEAIKRAEQGQQVLWIENMVNEAQAQYQKLAARAAECTNTIETGLLHSRFTQLDRSVNESTWVERFGKEGQRRRNEKGRILVGTQVLEQSLDIDADFLITRLCPTDMLLQRIGRLWRHRDTDSLRPNSARREVWILTAGYDQVLANYKQELRFCIPVYDPYVLLRTLELWRNFTVLNLPGDIRGLVEATYKERRENNRLLGELKSGLEKKRNRLSNFARLELSAHRKTETDSEGSTRYGDQKTIDVLLLTLAKESNDGSVSLAFPDGEPLELPPNLNRKAGREWRKRAAALNRHIVTVPEKQAPLPTPLEFLKWFKNYIYIGDDKETNALRIAMVKKSGELTDKYGNSLSATHILSYDRILGYQAEKKKVYDA